MNKNRFFVFLLCGLSLANFNSCSAQEFNINWNNYDNTTLHTSKVRKGEMPVYLDEWEKPTKPSTESADYVFDGWEPSIEEATKDATYTAKFKEEVKRFNITFKGGEGYFSNETHTLVKSYKYGDTIDFSTIEKPVKTPTDTEEYPFTKWTDADGKEVTTHEVKGETYFTANYGEDVRHFTVIFDSDGGTFNNVEGKPSKITQVIEYDEEFTVPENPVKDDAQYTYTFDHWDPEIPDQKKLTDDTTFKAIYTTVTKKYTITFDAGEGGKFPSNNQQKREYTLEYGSMPDPETPTKEGMGQSENIQYVFSGWSPELTTVIGTTTYTAAYEETEFQELILKFTYDSQEGQYFNIFDFTYDGSLDHVDWGDGTKDDEYKSKHTYKGLEHGQEVTVKIFGYFNKIDFSRVEMFSDKAYAPTLITSAEFVGPWEKVPESIFSNLQNLVSVTLCDSIKKIEDNAFSSCGKLEKFNLDNVQDVGYGALLGLKESFYSRDDKTGATYFKYKDNDFYILLDANINERTVTTQINDNCEIIATQAIRGDSYTKFTGVTISKNLKYLSHDAFVNCPAISTLTFPEGFIGCYENSLSYCFGLTQLNLPSTIEFIDDDLTVFKFKGITTDDSGSKYLGNEKNKYLVLVEGNEGGLFSSFSLNKNCKILAKYSLHYVSNVNLSISENVTFVASHVSSYTKFKSIEVSEKNPKYSSYNYNCVVERTTGRLVLGSSDTTIPREVKIIGPYAFVESNMKLFIPNTVKIIDSFAFYRVSSSQTISIPSSVIYISKCAFNSCAFTSFAIKTSEYYDTRDKVGAIIDTKRNVLIAASLATTRIPDGVVKIDEYAFEGIAIETIDLGKDLKEIGNYAFRDSHITKIIIPSNVEKIGYNAFNYIHDLTYCYIYKGVITIDSYIFHGCNSNLLIECGDDEKPDTWSDEWNRDYDELEYLVTWGVESPSM